MIPSSDDPRHPGLSPSSIAEVASASKIAWSSALRSQPVAARDRDEALYGTERPHLLASIVRRS